MKRVLLLLVPLLIAAAPPSKLQVSDAWVRESNPAVKVTAGFMTLTNPTAKPVVVTGVTSPAAKTVEMHEMKTVDGVMSMRQIPSITVPARGSVKLAPGGMHLMLIGLGERLTGGSTVELTLKTSEGSEIVVKAPVRTVENQQHHAH